MLYVPGPILGLVSLAIVVKVLSTVQLELLSLVLKNEEGFGFGQGFGVYFDLNLSKFRDEGTI